MNRPVRSPEAATPRPRGWRLAASLVGACLVLAAAAGCIPAPSGLHAVHDELREVLPGEWQTHIRVSAGRGWLTLGRAALAVAGADPQARAAARAVRDFKVSILRAASRSLAGGTLADALETAMRRRGWERNVVVREDRDLVAVYTQPAATDARRLPLCVWVWTEGELVLVTALGDLEAVTALVNEHLSRNGPGPHARVSLRLFAGWRKN